MYKNTASQKLYVYAYNEVTGEGQVGDAANITAQITKDGAASAATNDVNPTEIDAVDHPGVYYFNLLQAESNADVVIVSPVSSTANIKLDPVILHTWPADFADVATATALATVDTVVDSILADTGTDGVVLANDAITSAKYDESTAFPVKSADAGATQIARVGADGDTLETLSDEIAAVPTAAAIADAVCDEALSGHVTAGTVGAALGRIGSVAMSVSSPVASDSTLTLYAGTDYTAANSIVFTITDWTGYNVAAATGIFRVLPYSGYEAEDTVAVLTKAPTIAQTGTTVTVTLTLVAADTASLLTCPPHGVANYHYQVLATVAGPLTTVVVDGDMKIVKTITASA